MMMIVVLVAMAMAMAMMMAMVMMMMMTTAELVMMLLIVLALGRMLVRTFTVGCECSKTNTSVPSTTLVCILGAVGGCAFGAYWKLLVRIAVGVRG